MKGPRKPLTAEQLEQHRKDQMGFLFKSCIAFDRGDFPEAKRIAGVLRTLLHDAGRSASLFQLTGRKDQLFRTTARQPDIEQGHRLMMWTGLCGIAQLPSGMMFYPPLNDSGPGRPIPFSEWWSEPVMLAPDLSLKSREDVILGVANQEAQHVDSSLVDQLYEIRYENALRWDRYNADGSSEPAGEAQYVGSTIRQIAHEVWITEGFKIPDGYPVWSPYVGVINMAHTAP